MTTETKAKKAPKPQTGQSEFWTDEKGVSIPYSRTTKRERLAERNAHRILKGALSLNAALASFKQMVIQAHTEMVMAFEAEKDVDLSKTKGNHTWYNFDRSVRITAAAQGRIAFDDLTITAAQAKFNEFLDQEVTTGSEAVRELVQGAFQTSNSKLDPKLVLGLLPYRTKIKNSLFGEACDLIQESIRRSYAKTYYTVALRQDDGSYETVVLDIAAL